MDGELTARVAALEARLDAVEGRVGAAAAAGVDVEQDRLWALDRLKRDVVPLVEEGGVVLFTGAVDLPTGEHYEWQEAQPVGALLDEEWAPLAAALSALGHPVRLLLLREVLGGARTVAELGEHESLGTTGQLYHHLRQLTAAGWLRTTTRGRYGVPPERVVPLLTVLAGVRR